MIVESHTSKASNMCKDSGTGAHFFNGNVLFCFVLRKKKASNNLGRRVMQGEVVIGHYVINNCSQESLHEDQCDC